MTTRFALALTAGWLAAGPLFAGTPKIDRTIGKEPVYQTKAPKYGLLTFGPEGKGRVWLVLDGDTFYVDRNGNGDLTEPGEKVATEKKGVAEGGYLFDIGEVKADGLTHKALRVQFYPLKRYAGLSLGNRPDVKDALAKNPDALAAAVEVAVQVTQMKGGGIGGRTSFQAGPVDLTGVLQFADTPGEAPVIHLGGPLQVTFYGERPSLRVGRESEFILVVGTPGTGPGTFAMIEYRDCVPENAKPRAEVTYPPVKPGDPPVKETIDIKVRC